MTTKDKDIETNAISSSKTKGDLIPGNGKPNLKEKCLSVIETTSVTLFMTIVTIYALFSDDIKVLAFDKSSDTVFVTFSSIAFFLFLLEIVVQCWCRENYLILPKRSDIKKLLSKSTTRKEKWDVLKSVFAIGSFYFWLDLMATCSMIFEIPWLSPYSSDGVDSNFDNARAGKASKAGAKAARLTRMFRLFRLVKLYKYFNVNKSKKEGSVVPDDLSTLDNIQSESHVGAEMSDRTTKKVIVGILIMLMVIPLLQVDEIDYINELGMQTVLNRRVSSATGLSNYSTKSWKFIENYFVNSTECIDVLYAGFDDDVQNKVLIPKERSIPETLRDIEISTITVSSKKNKFSMTAAFNITERANEEALLGIFLTIFVIVLLGVGTMTFSRDVNNLVIIPIEKMVQLVREISANPLGKNFTLTPNEIKQMDDGMETTLLLRTISKIAGLMRIGFGEAGAEIIAKNLNMSSDEHGGSSMNLLGNGTKILSIFGFCDVRNFTDTTECLQEEVMLFVNRIAHILHSIVVQCDGAANKNIGDAFLLTWKLNPSKIKSCQEHNYAGDKALYSLLKTMIEMNRHENFICNFSPTSLGALYERMPGYKCRIGCGLHFGWAIEGAIGSDKKIDASYISPHVNMAEFLESSTKRYDVPILLSEPFYKLLSPNVTKYCRQVDNIRKSNNDDVMGIFTYDANLDFDFRKNTRKLEGKKKHTLRERKKTTLIQSRRSSKSKSNSFLSTAKVNCEVKPLSTLSMIREAPEIIVEEFSVDLWELDEDVVNLRKHFKDETRKIWNDGMQSYISGDWSSAKAYCTEVLNRTDNKDGPSTNLMDIMSLYGYKVPDNWKGYRGA